MRRGRPELIRAFDARESGTGQARRTAGLSGTMLVARPVGGTDGVERETERTGDTRGKTARELIDGSDPVDGQTGGLDRVDRAFGKGREGRKIQGEMPLDELARSRTGPHPVTRTVENHQMDPEFARAFVNVALAPIAAQDHDKPLSLKGLVVVRRRRL